MDRLFRAVLSIREVKYRHDDDFTDRLSRHYTMCFLAGLAFIVSTKQFVGKYMESMVMEWLLCMIFSYKTTLTE